MVFNQTDKEVNVKLRLQYKSEPQKCDSFFIMVNFKEIKLSRG